MIIDKVGGPQLLTPKIKMKMEALDCAAEGTAGTGACPGSHTGVCSQDTQQPVEGMVLHEPQRIVLLCTRTKVARERLRLVCPALVRTPTCPTPWHAHRRHRNCLRPGPGA